MATRVDDPNQPHFPVPNDLGPLLPLDIANHCRKAYLDGSRSFSHLEMGSAPADPEGASSALINMLWEYFSIGFRHSEHRHIQALAAAAPATRTTVPTPVPVAVPPEAQPQYICPQKLAEPDPFTGALKKCKEFLSQLALIFNNDPCQYQDNNRAKLSKAISYLCGDARIWASSH